MNSNAFLSPLSNRTHLMTIILVTVLFGVFRFSAGGIDSKPRQNASTAASVLPLKDVLSGTDAAASAESADAAALIGTQAKQLSADLGISDEPDASEVTDDAPAPRKTLKALQDDSKVDLLDEMMNRDRVDRKRQADDANKKEPTKLDDIQKMLGLK